MIPYKQDEGIAEGARLSLEGDGWSKRTARVGFPILVEYARNRQEITYGEWHSEIVQRRLGGPSLIVNYGRAAGTVGDACQEYAEQAGIKVPSINLMVVNKKTRLPGHGADFYIRRFCREFLDPPVSPDDLTVRDKRAIIERALEEIFDFPAWGEVLASFGLVEVEAEPARGRRREARRRPRSKGWRTGPESDAHRLLKERIAAAPTLVGLRTSETGAQEYSLWSGDRVDVYFKKAAFGVEVKAGRCSYDELHRGVFQCVKYRAVLRAQQAHDSEIPNADCVLAIGGDVPEDLHEVARLLRVQIISGLGQ